MDTVLLTVTQMALLALVAGGWVYARLRPIDEGMLGRLVLDVFMPCLVFRSLLEAEFSGADLSRIALAAVLLVIILLAVLWVVARRLGLDVRQRSAPVLFMNSGFLGIPLCAQFFGAEGTAYAVVFDQVQTLLIFTLGIWLLTGGRDWRTHVGAMLRVPVLWAIAAGFALRPFVEALPGPVDTALALVAAATTPLALFMVGATVARLRAGAARFVPAAVVLRLVGGLVGGVLLARLLGLSGALGGAVVLLSSLPSAVFSYVISQEYGSEPDYAAAVVVGSTVVSGLTIPAVLGALQAGWL